MERPFFFAGAVPNVTGAFAPVRYADRATKTKEIRAMTMPTVPYNGTASTPRIIDQPVSGMVGPYRVHTAPAPPPKGKGHSTFGHYKRPNADPARRGAYGSLKKAGMLPVIKPDDIGRSQIAGGTAAAGDFRLCLRQHCRRLGAYGDHRGRRASRIDEGREGAGPARGPATRAAQDHGRAMGLHCRQFHVRAWT